MSHSYVTGFVVALAVIVAPASGGAIQGESGRVVRWAEGGGQSPEIRTLAEIARRVLAAGRGSAFER